MMKKERKKNNETTKKKQRTIRKILKCVIIIKIRSEKLIERLEIS
jgi:hypothetical protein